MTKNNITKYGNNSNHLFTKDDVISSLKTIYDPEIPVNIYDLGLIYDINIKNKNLKITMTLTSPTCPMADEIPVIIADTLTQIDGVNKITISMVWEPAWDLTKMSDEAKFELDLHEQGW